jgi:hypothetical protein
MKRSASQSLISSSKKMLFILRVLFVLLIITAIIPWISPKSALGGFLLSMLSIMNFIDSPQNFDYFLNNLSAISKVLGFFRSIVNLLPLYVGILIMMKLSKQYISEQIFSMSTVKSYRN